MISRKTGAVWSCDIAPRMFPSTHPDICVDLANSLTFANQEAVPFRFTPNIQHFISPVGIEGVFTSSVLSIANSLTEVYEIIYH